MFKNFNFKNMDKKTKLYLGVGGGSIILLILLLIILKVMVGSRIGSHQFENRLKKAAIKYYEKYPDKLPKTSGNKVSISIDELVKNGNLKSLDKLLDKGLTCEGNVNVSNNNGFYLYQPIIKCSDSYETNLLYKKILSDNPVTTSGDGLYKVNDYYLYRGETLKNYASFTGKKYQIIKINNDNTIRMILVDNIDMTVWDNRYNNETENTSGKNDYSISRVRETLKEYFEDDKTFKKEEKALIVPQSLCIGARSEKTNINDGSIECSKKLDNEPLGLLQVNEYVLSSLEPTCKNIFDNQCTNYNYLANLPNTWTLTANSKNTYEVYKISNYVYSSNAEYDAQPQFVFTISADALYNSGDGTENNPYIIK